MAYQPAYRQTASIWIRGCPPPRLRPEPLRLPTYESLTALDTPSSTLPAWGFKGPLQAVAALRFRPSLFSPTFGKSTSSWELRRELTPIRSASAIYAQSASQLPAIRSVTPAPARVA